MSGPRRVIVGASGSPGNLGALRYAEHLARACDAVLIPVLAVPPATASPHAGHRPLWWVFWHRTLTPDDVLRDGGVSGGGSRYA